MHLLGRCHTIGQLWPKILYLLFRDDREEKEEAHRGHGPWFRWYGGWTSSIRKLKEVLEL